MSLTHKPGMDVVWEFVMMGGGVTDNRSLINVFWRSPLLPLCEVKLLDRKLKRAKEKKIGSQQQEKQTISPKS